MLCSYRNRRSREVNAILYDWNYDRVRITCQDILYNYNHFLRIAGSRAIAIASGALDCIRALARGAEPSYSDFQIMPNTRLPSSLFCALAMLGAVQYGYYGPRLPEIMASHFASNGAVNGWQIKALFFGIELAVLVLAALVGFGIPRIIAAIPVSLINLPNKEFWLGPERREGTLLYIRVWSAWFGCALLAFLLFVMELAFRANLRTPPRFNNSAFVPALLAFVVFDTIALVWLILHFSRPQGR